MKLSICLVLLGLFLSQASLGMGRKGDYIASGGLGLMTSPTLVLLSPELEYVNSSDVMYGGLIQMGLGEGGVLSTITGKVRYEFGTHARVRPCVEAGLGLALSSGLFESSVGVHILGGMGFDYLIEQKVSIGTMVRLNFAPPTKSFFLSWPIVIARFIM